MNMDLSHNYDQHVALAATYKGDIRMPDGTTKQLWKLDAPFKMLNNYAYYSRETILAEGGFVPVIAKNRSNN